MPKRCKERPLTRKEREYVSRKISTLMREGYPQRQAVAIAYSYLERKSKDCTNVGGRTVCYVCY